MQIFRYDEPDQKGFAPPPAKVSQFEAKATAVGIWEESLYICGAQVRSLVVLQ